MQPLNTINTPVNTVEVLIEEYKDAYWAVAIDGKNQLQSIEIDTPEESIRWGSIYVGLVRRIDKANDSAIIEIDKDVFGYLNAKDVLMPGTSLDENPRKITGAIGKSLQVGSKVIVQAKEGSVDVDSDDKKIDMPFRHKYPRLSMDISIQGRYLIFTPFMQENQISQRIRKKAVRQQLLDMLDEMQDIRGCILRSAAVNMQTDILRNEGKNLQDVWTQIQTSAAKNNRPALLHSGPNAIGRLLSHLAQDRINSISVVTMEHLTATQNWCLDYAPDLVTRIKPIEIPNAQTDLGLLDFRDVIGQIEGLFHSYCLLSNGANIIIQETAALTAIDVNRGSDKGSSLSINIEAARNFAHQMRLRNIGGIVICDFLKMRSKTEHDKLKKVLLEEFEKDSCTVQFHGFTKLGLGEISRQRRTPSLRSRLNHIDFH